MDRTWSGSRFVVGVALLAGVCAWGADPQPSEADPWDRKSRAEIVQLLGDPAKVKKDRGGRETLTYTFYRIAADAPPHPDALLLHVPGVGVVAKIDRVRTPDAVEIEPPLFDDQGRPVGGGVARSGSASTSYDPKTGELRQTASEPDNPLVKGKVKVRFELDASGRVATWSASGKK